MREPYVNSAISSTGQFTVPSTGRMGTSHGSLSWHHLWIRSEEPLALEVEQAGFGRGPVAERALETRPVRRVFEGEGGNNGGQKKEHK